MKKLFKSNKGYQIGDIPFLAIAFGIGIVVTSIIGEIVGDVQGEQTADTAEYNISGKGASGLLKLANWFTTLGLVIGAVIVLTALGALFIFGKRA